MSGEIFRTLIQECTDFFLYLGQPDLHLLGYVNTPGMNSSERVRHRDGITCNVSMDGIYRCEEAGADHVWWHMQTLKYSEALEQEFPKRLLGEDEVRIRGVRTV